VTNDSPYHRFLAARDRERDEGPTAEINAALRTALSDGLLAYCQDSDASNFNSEMAHYLHIALDTLSENSDHPLFDMARGRGRTGLHPYKKRCIADAVRYIRAARDGIIEDPSPIESVITAFTDTAADATLDQRTVERWLDRDDMVPWQHQPG